MPMTPARPPHGPNGDPSPHAEHDPILIAAGLDGDLEPADAQLVASRLASCESCAALDAELRAIRAEVVALPVPARPRDFRITATQAAAIDAEHAPAPTPAPRSAPRERTPEPAGQGSWLGRFRLARPVGIAMATMGLAGLLAGSVPAFAPAAGVLTTVGSNVGGSSQRDTMSVDGKSNGSAAAPEAQAGGSPAASDSGSQVPAVSSVQGGLNLTLIGGSLIVGAAGVVLVVRRPKRTDV